jgi:hypothetical protein
MNVVQDVVLHVPMEHMKDVERVKQALAIEGTIIYSLHRFFTPIQ